jgi:hypothetical protein
MANYHDWILSWKAKRLHRHRRPEEDSVANEDCQTQRIVYHLLPIAPPVNLVKVENGFLWVDCQSE